MAAARGVFKRVVVKVASDFITSSTELIEPPDS